MFFLKLVSRTFSIGSVFILFLICLTVSKYYKNSTGEFYLEIKSSKNKLTVGNKIRLEKSLSIGNQRHNDVILESSDNINVEIIIKNDQVILNNIGDSQYVKVGEKHIKGKIEIFINQIIHICDTSFQLILE